MTDRYEKCFAKLAKSGKKAFIPFTVLGWPDAGRCFQSIKCMIDSGASALEIGIAFSDPVADGPIIQEAAFETLDSGFSLQNGFDLLKRVRQYNNEIPIGLLTYYNTVLSQGNSAFFAKAAACGVDSVLIADLPAECADEIIPEATAEGVNIVFIVSPLTSDARLKKISACASGYIYVVSRLGITGTEERYDDQLSDLLARARKHTKLPLCVGFGVSTPAQATRMLAMGADGVITGSKIVQIIRQDPTAEFSALRSYLGEMCAVVGEPVGV